MKKYLFSLFHSYVSSYFKVADCKLFSCLFLCRCIRASMKSIVVLKLLYANREMQMDVGKLVISVWRVPLNGYRQYTLHSECIRVSMNPRHPNSAPTPPHPTNPDQGCLQYTYNRCTSWTDILYMWFCWCEFITCQTERIHITAWVMAWEMLNVRFLKH